MRERYQVIHHRIRDLYHAISIPDRKYCNYRIDPMTPVPHNEKGMNFFTPFLT
jgi:hypothetical protein